MGHLMRVVTIGSLVVALVLAAGCTSDDRSAPQATDAPPSPVALSGLRTVVKTTLRTKPNHVTMSATFAKNGGQPHTQKVDAHRGGAPGRELATFVTDGSHAEVRRMGGSGWLRSAQPRFSKQLPSGKPWLRLSASQLTASGLPTVDELLSLLYVSRGTDKVGDHGGAKIDGVVTRVTSFDVDLEQAVCGAPKDARLDIATLMNSDPKVSRSIRVRVWTDRFHLVRRLDIRARTQGVTADYDLRVMGDNATARVQAPPPGKTTDIARHPKLDRAMSSPRPEPPEC